LNEWVLPQLSARQLPAYLALLGKGLHAQQHKAERQALQAQQTRRLLGEH